MEEQQIRSKLYDLMQDRFNDLGLKPNEIDENTSLLGQGIYDSLAFVEFIGDIEETFDVEIDFDEMDASEFTSIKSLINLIRKAMEPS